MTFKKSAQHCSECHNIKMHRIVILRLAEESFFKLRYR